MASLAPGNGWLPPRTYCASENPFVRTARSQATRPAAEEERKGILAKVFDLLVVEAVKAGSVAVWLLAGCVIAMVFALLIWLGVLGALVGSAVAIGISWATAAVALAIAHFVVAILVIAQCLKIGRKLLLSAERRGRRSARRAL